MVIGSRNSQHLDQKCIAWWMKNVVYNAAKGVPRNVMIDGKKTNVKNINLYRHVLEATSKNDAVIDGTFKRVNNQKYTINTMEQTKTLMTCIDNKRWICDDNVHTLVFGLTNCLNCKEWE